MDLRSVAGPKSRWVVVGPRPGRMTRDSYKAPIHILRAFSELRIDKPPWAALRGPPEVMKT